MTDCVEEDDCCDADTAICVYGGHFDEAVFETFGEETEVADVFFGFIEFLKGFQSVKSCRRVLQLKVVVMGSTESETAQPMYRK